MFAQIVGLAQNATVAAAQGTPAGQQQASLNAEQMNEVVSRVQQRWMAAIDREDPEIVDEFLRSMKSAIHEVHVKEGYPFGKIAKSRSGEDDWLTKIVVANKKMQDMLPKFPEKEDRSAIADSWKHDPKVWRD